MRVDAKNLTISSILKKGKFIIPDYQREYDWQTTEIDEFLSDLASIKDDEDYFIGSLVVTGEFSGDEFKVIDGQQRITTITILLSVLRDKLYELKEDTLALGLNTFIFNTNAKGQEFAVLENRMPYPLLQAYVQSNPKDKNFSVVAQKEGEKKIKKAYDYILREISAYSKDEIELLRDKVLNLIAVFVTVDNESDGFTIFETLNARGKDLAAFDLIKNQVFKNFPTLPHIKEPEDTWNKIKKNIDNSSDKFLNNFWASRYKKVASRKIYKAFEQNILKDTTPPSSLSDRIKEFVTDLYADSILFEKITNPKLSDWKKYSGASKIFFPLEALKLFKVEIANAFIMTLLREYESKHIKFKNLVSTLRAIEKFHFMHTAIGSQKGSGLDVFYAGYAKDLNKAVTINDKHQVLNLFQQSLQSKLTISEAEFIDNFKKKLVFSKNMTKNKPLVQYVLNMFEKIDSNCNKILLEDSIEHIYPEVPVVGWVSLSDPNNTFIIGNLVNLDRDLNSKIGSKIYTDKKSIVLAESTLVHTKNVFTNNADWNENTIIQRTNELATRAFNEIWKL